jgi:septum formation inhibitor MinC
MDEFSHLGYTVWFGLIEIICKETGKDLTKKFECKPQYLRRKLRTSQTKLREVFEYCQRDGRLLATFSQERWEFQLPKIAEIKDNYTKDLQVTSKKPSKHKEVEVDKEVEKKKIKKKKENVWNPPIDLNVEAWSEFEQHRKDIKKPLNELSKIKNSNMLIEYNRDEQQEIVDATIASNWTGLFHLKKDKKHSTEPELDYLP